MPYLINQYKTISKMNNLDIISTIFSFLCHKEIITCSYINKLYNKICNDQYIKLLMNDYDIKYTILFNKSYKETYIKCHQLNILKNIFKNNLDLSYFFNLQEL